MQEERNSYAVSDGYKIITIVIFNVFIFYLITKLIITLITNSIAFRSFININLFIHNCFNNNFI